MNAAALDEKLRNARSDGERMWLEAMRNELLKQPPSPPRRRMGSASGSRRNSSHRGRPQTSPLRKSGPAAAYGKVVLQRVVTLLPAAPQQVSFPLPGSRANNRGPHLHDKAHKDRKKHVSAPPLSTSNNVVPLKSENDVDASLLAAEMASLRLSAGPSNNISASQDRAMGAVDIARERGYMLFEEYQAAVEGKILPAYESTNPDFPTPEARYAKGWVYKLSTGMWHMKPLLLKRADKGGGRGGGGGGRSGGGNSRAKKESDEPSSLGVMIPEKARKIILIDSKALEGSSGAPRFYSKTLDNGGKSVAATTTIDMMNSLVNGFTGLNVTNEGGILSKEAAARPRPSGEAAMEAALERGYMLLEEYEAAVAAKLLKPYKSTSAQYSTAQDRYSDGWVFKPDTKRWCKGDKQEELTKVKLMKKENEALKEDVALLSAAVSKAAPGTSAAARDPTLAPLLLLVDTNCWLKILPQLQLLIGDIAAQVPSATVLIPREVLRELDRKKADKDETLAFRARAAARFIDDLMGVSATQEGGRQFPLARGQDDSQLHRDEGHHRNPQSLRGDDAILNCALFMTKVAMRRVCLCSDDRLFRQRALANGIVAMDPEHVSAAGLRELQGL